ncbi:conserved exported hypothetical protein [Cupriavidus taiwanensis]|uniref:Lipoprotein n=1 Tax=Cupriavidus taiwanensis TaxID=164546 RepID=A0A975XDM4_9BURK|nr:hypothetical protein [Cupriavidus taiwanensis]SOY67336.1 conserved exported hypothetical protein [Cupriavidus taiwanensis]
MRQLVTPAALLSAIALLAACGGGDDGTNAPAPIAPPSDNSPAPAPSPSPTPGPAPAPNPDPTPTPVGELLPSLSAPQPGSTAAVGNGSEGLWVGLMNATLVDRGGKFMHLTASGVISGTFQFAGSSWKLSPDSIYESAFLSLATGAGTLTPGQRLSGSIVRTSSGATTALANTYDPSNALAVDQAAIAGNWQQSGFAMQIDAAGNLTGTHTSGTRICDLHGTVTLAEPGSAKNLYAVSVSADARASASGCSLTTGMPHKGFAAIRLMPADGSVVITSATRYVRTLVMTGTTGYGGYFTTQLSKPVP